MKNCTDRQTHGPSEQAFIIQVHGGSEKKTCRDIGIDQERAGRQDSRPESQVIGKNPGYDEIEEGKEIIYRFFIL